MPMLADDEVKSLGTGFAELWNVAKDLKVVTEQPRLCSYAAKFSEWADQLCAEVAKEPKIATVNQGKLLLQDKYFECTKSVPPQHRVHSGKSHLCIFQVYAQTYERLRAVELSLKPLLLPEVPLPQYAGIILGQLEEELSK